MIARDRQHLRQSGVAAVEFAVVLVFLLPIIAGIVELGRAFWYYDAVLKGTRDAARYLSTATGGRIKDATAGDTAIDIAVRTATAAGVPGFGDTNVTVTCAPTACGALAKASDVTEVTVGAQYTFGIGSLIPFVGPGGAISVTLAPHTTMPYMW